MFMHQKLLYFTVCYACAAIIFFLSVQRFRGNEHKERKRYRGSADTNLENDIPHEYRLFAPQALFTIASKTRASRVGGN